jgi:hypothetical protein
MLMCVCSKGQYKLTTVQEVLSATGSDLLEKLDSIRGELQRRPLSDLSGIIALADTIKALASAYHSLSP